MDMDLVDPELRKRYRFLGSVPIGNRWFVKLTRLAMPLAPKVAVPADVQLDVIRDGQVDGMRVYTPVRDPDGDPVRDRDGSIARGALLWIHGGGMMIGAAAQDDARCFELARALDIVVVSAEYRLAPEHPFPAPLDDCFNVWMWLLRHAADLGIDRTRMAVGGQSAGGGLAASLAQRLHDAAHDAARDTGDETGVVEPIAQWLFCPMLDDRTAADRALDSTKHPLWNNKSNRSGWSAYLGVAPGAPAVPEFAVPSRRTDLSGLPPAWIGTGDIELFYEENRAYAQALRAAGVECVLDVVPGAPHAFESFGGETTLARAYLDRSFAWLGAHLDQ